VFEKLKRVVGDGGWTSDPADLEPHLTEWRGTWRGATPLMLRPSTTQQVADIVSLCAAHAIPVVPQGGNTGLCGGAIPDRGGQQVLLSLSRLNRVRSISPDNFSMVAEAGCVLADLKRRAHEAGRLFPLSLAAEGSCQIGGNLSTNAGGTNVLRYGTARDQVLGLEVVLADGTVLNGLRTLRKDTAGYDLKQLFIGAEGTLGIITAAALRLYPPLRHTGTAWLAVPTPRAAVRLLGELRVRLADQLLAFELIAQRALQLVLRHVDGTRSPLHGESPWYVLLEASLGGASDDFEEVLMAMLECGLASDAVIAKSSAERDALWHVRHAISEAQKREGASLKHDVSVPVDRIGDFIEAAEAAVLAQVPAARVVAFGHVGDGNVHFNVSQPRDADAEGFLAQRATVARIVYDVVARFDGSFSAEHGVGVLKREALVRYRSAAEVRTMRALKQWLDPANILNPGKVL